LPYALQAPFLTPDAAAAVLRARRLRHPVWLLGGPGAGAYEVARALHEEGGWGGFVSVRQPLAAAVEIEDRVRLTLESDPSLEGLSLYVERVERQLPAVQERLLRWSDEGVRWAGRAVSFRLLAQSDESHRPGDLLPALRHRLSVLTIALPSLAARRAEIPGIALALADCICAELGLPAPVIDEAALRRLSERDWPGNLDELAAVLTHALIAADGDRVTDFGVPAIARRGAPLRPSGGPAARTAGTGVGRPTGVGQREARELELIIAELAHELKNPMVTIKTFADNLEQLLNDPGLREKFVGLTREAIDRMDSFLEDLLRFSRYTEPRLQTLSLNQALTRALEANEVRVRERVKTNGLTGKHMVRVDEEQITFAFKSLVRGLCREIPLDASILVDVSPGGDLVFHSSASGGMQQKLHGTLDQETNGNTPWSLDLMMAEALIRRNGGSSRIVRESDELQVHVSFPSPERGVDAR
jgi:signal transduction histidine kinase